jgi:hypothetical protein
MGPALGVVEYSTGGAAAGAAALAIEAAEGRGSALPTPLTEMDWEGTVAEKGLKGHL